MKNFSICIQKLVRQVKVNMEFLNKTENLFVVRFEDLVGSKGGGSDKAQYEVVRRLCEALRIPVQRGKINTILESLYGNSVTFRKGMIGEWKKSFKEGIKCLLKIVRLGPL